MLQKIGLGFFICSILVFTLMLGMDTYVLTPESLVTDNDYHQTEILEQAEKTGMIGKEYGSTFSFVSDFKNVLQNAQASLNGKEIPEGVGEWDFKLGDWKIKDYTFATIRQSGTGMVSQQPLMCLNISPPAKGRTGHFWRWAIPAGGQGSWKVRSSRMAGF